MNEMLMKIALIPETTLLLAYLFWAPKINDKKSLIFGHIAAQILFTKGGWFIFLFLIYAGAVYTWGKSFLNMEASTKWFNLQWIVVYFIYDYKFLFIYNRADQWVKRLDALWSLDWKT